MDLQTHCLDCCRIWIVVSVCKIAWRRGVPYVQVDGLLCIPCAGFEKLRSGGLVDVGDGSKVGDSLVLDCRVGHAWRCVRSEERLCCWLLLLLFRRYQ
jgi:hypothetical protein